MSDQATVTPSAAATPGAAPAIRWYRSPIEREALRQVMQKSNWLAAAQTGGYLAVILSTAAATIWAGLHGPWWSVPPLLFLHGMVMSFLINAVHELGHETVFTNRRVNRFFAAVFAFPAWINHHHFAASHGRHHRYTLHPPHDLEVTLPITITRREFWSGAFVNLGLITGSVKNAWRLARGRFAGPWEAVLFPTPDHEDTRATIRWGRILLVGHLAILVGSIALQLWIVPVVVSFGHCFGGWLWWLCNSTQHVGLEQDVPDARRCCRTFLLNPVVRFLYWHMNYHTEHHMFAAVPCYRLGRLHRLMRDDLPPCPDGLVATWRHIGEIMRRQAADPTYCYVPPLPTRPAPALAPQAVPA